MYIVIVGAGQVGYYLTKDLLSDGHEVTLVDWNYARVQQLDQELGSTVLYAYGTSIDGLEKAGCSRADVIVAVTGDDEDNLVACQLGKRYFNIPKAIARINNPKNERVFKELGIGTTVSGTTSISEAIERYVAKQQLTTLLTFDHDEMVLIEAEIQTDSPVVWKKISEIELPYDSIIAMILRGRNVVFARGDTVFEPRDMVIAISTKNEQDKLKNALLGSSEV